MGKGQFGGRSGLEGLIQDWEGKGLSDSSTLQDPMA